TPSEDISPSQARPINEPVDPGKFPAIARLVMPDATRMAFDGTAPSGHTIRIDTGPASGGDGTGSEPKALLLIALGTCTGMDVISILHKKRQVVSSYEINVYATEAHEHPKVYTSILVEHVLAGPKVDAVSVSRSIELSITKYCPVHALLSRVVPIEHVYRILE
ncbi:MAG: OsmC family protein, partial [Chloroflexia bacterium]